MILNNERLPVWEWTGGASFCPECGEGLNARRPDSRVWHWAHKPNPTPPPCSLRDLSETPWHLAMKFAYLSFPGWEIERRLNIQGKIVVVDAFNEKRFSVREFVHGTSSDSNERVRMILQEATEALWILDGDVFVNAHRKPMQKGGGYRHFLKTLKWEDRERMAMMAHWQDTLWRPWDKNPEICWPMNDSRACTEICRRFTDALAEINRRFRKGDGEPETEAAETEAGQGGGGERPAPFIPSPKPEPKPEPRPEPAMAPVAVAVAERVTVPRPEPVIMMPRPSVAPQRAPERAPEPVYAPAPRPEPRRPILPSLEEMERILARDKYA